MDHCGKHYGEPSTGILSTNSPIKFMDPHEQINNAIENQQKYQKMIIALKKLMLASGLKTMGRKQFTIKFDRIKRYR